MFSDALDDFKLVLASASPRRRQLMEEAGFRFTSATIDYEETWPSGLTGRQIAEFLAAGKADSYKTDLEPDTVLITADTVVWCRETYLGKPVDKSEAAHFLNILSGCEHEVITGICLRNRERKHTFSVSTTVTFRELEEEEIRYYVDNFSPLDKAGAYGIQEWIWLRGITRINGSYYNVVGMPVSELYNELLAFTGNKTTMI
jgi:septum formation protein